MLKDKELTITRDISKKYHVRRVLFFGSSLDATDNTHDVGLAIEGIAPEAFFEYYGDLLMRLPRAVDVVGLSISSKFNELIYRDGVAIYE